MKKTKTILSVILISFLMTSTSFTSSQTPKTTQYSFDDPELAVDVVGQALGMMREFGASGAALGQVLQMMFQNFFNFNSTSSPIPGVYVMNGSIIQPRTTYTHNFGELGDSRYYRPWGVYNLSNLGEPGFENEYPYMKINQTGRADIAIEEGASVTFIIWDNDGTLIRALDKIIETVKEFQEIQLSGENNEEKRQQIIGALIEAITYFLIHINDIITGDEVIIVNVIGFTNYEISFSEGTVTGEWFSTVGLEMTDTVLLNEVCPGFEGEYRTIAESYHDDEMLWYLDGGYATMGSQNYSKFSFDLIEIWLKNFEIHINVAAIIEAINAIGKETEEDPFEGTAATEIFQGLDVEFYILTHHFSNWYLYDDTLIEVNGVPDVKFNSTTGLIQDYEVTDYIVFRGADFHFNEPIYNTTSNKMTWGIRADDLQFRVIPIGMKEGDANMTISPLENMEYFEMGFSFEPYVQRSVQTEEFSIEGPAEARMGIAKVKLIQSFGEWNNGSGPNTPRLIGRDLDLTTVYMSTMLHFHLNVQNTRDTTDISELSDNETRALLDELSYRNNSFFVGNAQNDLPLAEVNITGPAYTQGSTEYPAFSAIIPQLFANYTGEGQKAYVQSDGTLGVIGAELSIKFSIIYYAVSYPSFGNSSGVSGQEIIHDPTFSLYIDVKDPGVWAIILVIGMVALVGIAAVLITKRKNATFAL